ncbi:MAG: VWA domain-containing protein [Bryobacteraceae bacterium]
MERIRSQRVAALAILGLVLAGVLALGEEPVFRVDVNLVRILATVKDDSGRLIGTLEKSDFAVWDDGTPQQLAIFERRTEQPLSIALLVDTSLSTAIDLRYEMDSVERFLRAVFSEGNPKDAVALYSFSYDVTLRASFTGDRSKLESAARAMRPQSGTSLYDAIFLASRDLDTREGRRVMILVTDGGDTTSAKNFHQALEAAQRADAVLYAILVMPIKSDVGRNIGGENALTMLSAGTGGRVFTPSLGTALDEALSAILKELRTQYYLAYYPKDSKQSGDRYHKLEVKVLRPDLRVFARNGYYEETEATPKLRPGRWHPATKTPQGVDQDGKEK